MHGNQYKNNLIAPTPTSLDAESPKASSKGKPFSIPRGCHVRLVRAAAHNVKSSMRISFLGRHSELLYGYVKPTRRILLLAFQDAF